MSGKHLGIYFVLIVCFWAMVGVGGLFAADSIKEPTELVGMIMMLAEKSGCRCNNATVHADPAALTMNIDLAIQSENLGQQLFFFELVSQNWKAAVPKVTIGQGLNQETGKAQINTSLVLKIVPNEKPDSGSNLLKSILEPLVGLEFYPAFSGKPLDGVKLVGVRFEEGKEKSFQVAAPTLKDFSPFLNDSKIPGFSGSLSKSGSFGIGFYSLDLSNDSTLTSAGKMISDCVSLEKLGDLLEVKTADEPYGESFKEIRLRGKLSVLREICSVFSNVMKVAPRIGNFQKSSAPEVWDFHFVVKREDSSSGISFEKILPVMQHSWPENLGNSLNLTWNPEKSDVSLDIPLASADRELKGRLRSELENLGFVQEVQKQAKSKESGEDVYQVTYSLAGNSSRQTSDVFSEFLKKVDVIGTKPIPNGREYSVRLDFDRVPELMQVLAALRSQSLVRFSLSSNINEQAQADFSLKDEPGSKSFLEFVKTVCSRKLPWNEPEDTLRKSVLINKFEIDSDGKFSLFGQTLKSGRIFSTLFPILQNIPKFGEPFFSQGKYSDHKWGRLMNFEITGSFY